MEDFLFFMFKTSPCNIYLGIHDSDLAFSQEHAATFSYLYLLIGPCVPL